MNPEVEKYLLARGGGPVEIKAPAKSEKPSKLKVLNVPPSEDKLVPQLARITKQRGTEAQKTLDKIAESARRLKFVPEEKSSEIVWLDEDDDETA